MTDLKKAGELAVLAEKFVQYKHNLSYVYFFFAFGSLYAGWLLVLVATEWIRNPYVLISSMIACAVLGIAMLKVVFAETFRKIKRGRIEGLYWVLSFAAPFVGVHMLFGSLNFPDVLFTSGFAWYLSLGIALISVAILVENWYVKSRVLLTRPFLIAGILLILTAPLVLLIADYVHQYSGNPLGLGLMLISYLISGTVTLIRAENVFK